MLTSRCCASLALLVLAPTTTSLNFRTLEKVETKVLHDVADQEQNGDEQWDDSIAKFTLKTKS